MSELRTLHDVIARFERAGEHPAVIAFEDHNPITRSYFDLANAAHRAAGRVSSFNVEARSPIALIGPNSTDWISIFWGLAGLGRIVMPLDAQYSDTDLAHMLSISSCRLAVVARSAAERVRTIAPACEIVTFEDVLSGDDDTHVFPLPDRSTRPPGSNDTAVLLFTSGTTGTPKAVPLTHSNLLADVRALLAEGLIRTSDRGLVPLPLHHSFPLTVGMLTVFAAGATLVLPSGVSGPELIGAIKRGRVTILLGVPRLYESLFASILVAVRGRTWPSAPLFSVLLTLSRVAHRMRLPIGRFLFGSLRNQLGSELRILVCGGAAIPSDVEEGLDALGWEVLTGYGLTETSPVLTFNRRGQARVGSVGPALAGITLRVSEPDAEGLGEIQARGDSVFAGYLDDPVATRAAFTPDGWFKTGDLGRLSEDSFLTVVGRINDTIVLPDGRKLLLETVEAAYAPLSMIRELAAIPSRSGLLALVVPDFDAIRSAGATRIEHLIRETLDAHARTLPSHYRFTGFAVLREPLPRTPLGKIRRGRLRQLYEAARSARGIRPKTSLSVDDAALLDDPVGGTVWRWLQGRYMERSLDLDISPQLDLGIDSLGWIQFTLELERQLGIQLTEREIASVLTLRDFLRQAIAASARGQKAVVLGAEQTRWLAPLGKPALALRYVGEMVVRSVIKLAFSLRVEGQQNLPEQGPFLLCPNHSSYLDAFVLSAALPHRHLRSTCWAGWTGILFHTRLRRLFSRLAYVIPVDPDRALASNLAISALALERGHNLVWFPEGAMSSDGMLRRFLPGIGALLERKSVPVVPVLISGTRAALPPGRHLPSFRPVHVRFGAVLDEHALCLPGARDPEQRIADEIHAAVAHLESG